MGCLTTGQTGSSVFTPDESALMDVYLMFGGIEAEIISERGGGTLIDGHFEKSDARKNNIKKIDPLPCRWELRSLESLTEV